MADIDKSLQNVKTSIEVDPQEEIEIEQEKALEAEDPGVEVTPNEDGSVEVNFDPSKVNIEGTPNHFDNLAELLPEDITDPIGSELVENYMDYKSSRKEWEQAYTTGLDLLGFKYENRTEPFQGASGATHPVLAEAVTQFQAGAYKELLPAEGPVRTQIVGNPDREKEAQANRVKDYMNYELMEKMNEYEQLNGTTRPQRGDEYEAKKELLSKQLLEVLFELLPKLRDALDYYEFSTPLSTQFYQLNAKGEIYGLDHFVDRFQQSCLLPQIPLNNLYMTEADAISARVDCCLLGGVMSTMCWRGLQQG